jgi:hypothetical protein
MGSYIFILCGLVLGNSSEEKEEDSGGGDGDCFDVYAAESISGFV